MWRNMSCRGMFSHDRFLHTSNEKCCKICFVAIYALLCGEKLNQKLCLWRKKDKYQVWADVLKSKKRGFSPVTKIAKWLPIALEWHWCQMFAKL